MAKATAKQTRGDRDEDAASVTATTDYTPTEEIDGGERGRDEKPKGGFLKRLFSSSPGKKEAKKEKKEKEKAAKKEKKEKEKEAKKEKKEKKDKDKDRETTEKAEKELPEAPTQALLEEEERTPAPATATPRRPSLAGRAPLAARPSPNPGRGRGRPSSAARSASGPVPGPLGGKGTGVVAAKAPPVPRGASPVSSSGRGVGHGGPVPGGILRIVGSGTSVASSSSPRPMPGSPRPAGPGSRRESSLPASRSATPVSALLRPNDASRPRGSVSIASPKASGLRPPHPQSPGKMQGKVPMGRGRPQSVGTDRPMGRGAGGALMKSILSGAQNGASRTRTASGPSRPPAKRSDSAQPAPGIAALLARRQGTPRGNPPRVAVPRSPSRSPVHATAPLGSPLSPAMGPAKGRAFETLSPASPALLAPNAPGSPRAASDGSPPLQKTIAVGAKPPVKRLPAPDAAAAGDGPEHAPPAEAPPPKTPPASDVQYFQPAPTVSSAAAAPQPQTPPAVAGEAAMHPPPAVKSPVPAELSQTPPQAAHAAREADATVALAPAVAATPAQATPAKSVVLTVISPLSQSQSPASEGDGISQPATPAREQPASPAGGPEVAEEAAPAPAGGEGDVSRIERLLAAKRDEVRALEGQIRTLRAPPAPPTPAAQDCAAVAQAARAAAPGGSTPAPSPSPSSAGFVSPLCPRVDVGAADAETHTTASPPVTAPLETPEEAAATPPLQTPAAAPEEPATPAAVTPLQSALVEVGTIRSELHVLTQNLRDLKRQQILSPRQTVVRDESQLHAASAGVERSLEGVLTQFSETLKLIGGEGSAVAFEEPRAVHAAQQVDHVVVEEQQGRAGVALDERRRRTALVHEDCYAKELSWLVGRERRLRVSLESSQAATLTALHAAITDIIGYLPPAVLDRRTPARPSRPPPMLPSAASDATLTDRRSGPAAAAPPPLPDVPVVVRAVSTHSAASARLAPPPAPPGAALPTTPLPSEADAAYGGWHGSQRSVGVFREESPAVAVRAADLPPAIRRWREAALEDVVRLRTGGVVKEEEGGRDYLHACEVVALENILCEWVGACEARGRDRIEQEEVQAMLRDVLSPRAISPTRVHRSYTPVSFGSPASPTSRHAPTPLHAVKQFPSYDAAASQVFAAPVQGHGTPPHTTAASPLGTKVRARLQVKTPGAAPELPKDASAVAEAKDVRPSPRRVESVRAAPSAASTVPSAVFETRTASASRHSMPYYAAAEAGNGLVTAAVTRQPPLPPWDPSLGRTPLSRASASQPAHMSPGKTLSERSWVAPDADPVRKLYADPSRSAERGSVHDDDLGRHTPIPRRAPPPPPPLTSASVVASSGDATYSGSAALLRMDSMKAATSRLSLLLNTNRPV